MPPGRAHGRGQRSQLKVAVQRPLLYVRQFPAGQERRLGGRARYSA